MGIVWSGQPGRGTPGRLQLSELRWGALHPSTERAGEIGVFLIPQAGGNIGDAHVGLDEEMKGPLAAHDFKDFPVKIAQRRGMNAAGASWRPAQPFCSTRSRVGGLHHRRRVERRRRLAMGEPAGREGLTAGVEARNPAASAVSPTESHQRAGDRRRRTGPAPRTRGPSQ